MKPVVVGSRWEAKYATSFDGLLAAVETVTYAQQPNGEWKAIGYLIRPAGDKARGWKIAFWVMLGVLLLNVGINAAVSLVTAWHQKKQTGRAVTLQSPSGTTRINVTSAVPVSVVSATQNLDLATRTLTVSEPATVTIGSGLNVDERAAIHDWLALMDAGAYLQSWETASVGFRRDGKPDAWVKLLEKVRQPLGQLISRKEISGRPSQAVPGLPRGFYFIAQFETSFAELTNAVETVVFIQENARQWRAASYLIRPRTAEQTAAVRAAEQWLAGIDAGRYAESWTGGANLFHQAVTPDKWVSILETVRQPLGAVKIRTVNSAVTTFHLPDAPVEKYVVVEFDTAFASQNPAMETVTLVQEKSGQWKPVGYNIK